MCFRHFFGLRAAARFKNRGIFHFCVQALLEPAVQPGTLGAGAPGEILNQKLGFSKQKVTSPGSYSPSSASK